MQGWQPPMVWSTLRRVREAVPSHATPSYRRLSKRVMPDLPPPPPPSQPPVAPGACFSDTLLPQQRDSLVQRASKALQRGAVGGVMQRLSDSLELPVLLQRYGKNTLTHGVEYLRGDDELPVFVAGARGLPTWYPVPDEDRESYSKATVVQTEQGTILMHGSHGGPKAGLQMLSGGKGDRKGRDRLGTGACGMGSSARWNWDLSQHHWLEFTMRSDGRKYELVLQVDGQVQDSHWFWRAPLPVGLAPTRRQVAGGPYSILEVDPDATDEQLRAAYRALAKQAHPDSGGTEERFKVLSTAYALLSNPEARRLYDELGLGYEAGGGGELGEWQRFKLPFTAFRDRRLHKMTEQVGHVYILLADQEPGPFRLELGAITAGRCVNAGLPAAGFFGTSKCELGFCECGYYNGWRVEAFTGPLTPDQLPHGPAQMQHGFAHHHNLEEDGPW